MNILFVIPDLRIGGAQTFLVRLASYLKQRGHTVFIYLVHPNKIDSEIYNFFSANVPVINRFYFEFIRKFEKNSFAQKIVSRLINPYVYDRKRLRKFIKHHHIQIINSHMYLADLYISRLNLPKIPKVSSWHGCYNLLLSDFKQNNTFQENKDKIKDIFPTYKHIIFAAEKHKSAYERFGIEVPYTKIYYGFPELENINPAPFDKDSAFVFGMVARGDKTKGWAAAVEAFKILKSQIDKPVKLVLVGDSDFLRELKEQNEDSDIIFAGATDNPLGWIYHFDVGLLPTYFPAESLPNTVIEYLAMGKPVIATRWAEIPKMLDSGQGSAGVLIDVVDGKADIGQLSEAMQNLLGNCELYDALRQRASLAFRKFSMETCAQKYLDVFSKYALPSQ